MLLKNQKGAAMVVALMVLLIVSLLGGALWQYSSTDRLQVFRDEKSMQAYYIARAGADATRAEINEILKSITWGSQTEVTFLTSESTFENGTFIVEVNIKKNSDDSKKITIESTGKVQDVNETVKIVLNIIPGALPEDPQAVFPSTVSEDDWRDGTTSTTDEPTWVDTGNGHIVSDIGGPFEAVSFPENLTVDHQKGQQLFTFNAENFYFKNTGVSLDIKQGNTLRLNTGLVVFKGNVTLQGDQKNNYGILKLCTPNAEPLGKVYFYEDVQYYGNQNSFKTLVKAGAYYFKNGVELWGQPNITEVEDWLIPIQDSGNSDTTWQ